MMNLIKSSDFTDKQEEERDILHFQQVQKMVLKSESLFYLCEFCKLKEILVI